MQSLGTALAPSSVVSLTLGDFEMNIGPIPVVAIGTLSGNLPTGAGAKTLGAPPVASGDSFKTVSLDESNAVTGVTFNAFSAPKTSADTPVTDSMLQQLLNIQEQNQS
jgi:hypothetical protein